MELLIATRANTGNRGKFILHRPKGAVLGGKTRAQVRRKWIEIAGDLMSPQKRVGREGFAYHDQITGVWRREWLDVWRSLQSGDLTLAEAWTALTDDGVLLGALPMDQRGDTHCTNAWPWTRAERRLFLVEQFNEQGMTEAERQAVWQPREIVVDRQVYLISPHRVEYWSRHDEGENGQIDDDHQEWPPQYGRNEDRGLLIDVEGEIRGGNPTDDGGGNGGGRGDRGASGGISNPGDP